MTQIAQVILTQLLQLAPQLLPKLMALLPGLFVSVLTDLGAKPEEAKAFVNEAVTVINALGGTTLPIVAKPNPENTTTPTK